MIIRRQRQRSTGSVVTPDYSSIQAAPIRFASTPVGSGYRLYVREGIFPTALKPTDVQLSDVLTEGYKAWDRWSSDRQAFSPLLRAGSWPIRVGSWSHENGVSTVNVPSATLYFPSSAALVSLLTARGYKQGLGSVYSIEFSSWPPNPSKDEADATAEFVIAQSYARAYFSPAVVKAKAMCSCYWARNSQSVPTPDAVPEAVGIPTELQETSTSMDAARFDALTALQTGGERVRGLNRAQVVLECRDVPATAKQILEFARFMGQMKGLYPSWAVTATLGQMAGAYLWWKFGVCPSVNDAKAWMSDTIAGKAVALLEPAEDILHVGDTVRCAYGVENPNTRHEFSGLTTWENSRTLDLAGRLPGQQTTLDPFYGMGDLPAECAVDGMTSSGWKHEGVLFSKALTPELAMTPDWVWDLYPELGRDQVIASLSRTRRALLINPPLNTAWKLAGWSWLVDWVANVGKTLARLESITTKSHIRCAFEKLWSCDRWRHRPRWPKPVFQLDQEVLLDSHPKVVLRRWGPNQYGRTGVYVDVYSSWTGTCRVSTKFRLQNLTVNPSGLAERILVDRKEIPKPRIPPVQVKVRVDASRIRILGAISTQRLVGLLEHLRHGAKLNTWHLGKPALSAARLSRLLRSTSTWVSLASKI